MELLQALDQFLAENVKGVSVDPQAVLAHVIRPSSFYGASSERGTGESTVPFKPGPPPGLEPLYLDVSAFKVALDNALKDVVAGYVAQLRQSGQILFTNAWQYAKRPQDDSEPWTPDVQMHVASVSKLMIACVPARFPELNKTTTRSRRRSNTVILQNLPMSSTPALVRESEAKIIPWSSITPMQ